MLKHIEQYMGQLTQANVQILIEDDENLGATYSYPNHYLVIVNVQAHMREFGSDALDQLFETVRHEAAHVEHTEMLKPQIVALANDLQSAHQQGVDKYGWGVLSYEHHFDMAAFEIQKGKNSYHGPEWKKMARKLGAAPRAKAKTGA